MSSFDNEEGKKLFSYDSEMSNRFKLIITYILRENENNEVKIRCNNLLSKWLSHKFEDGVFYEKESLDKLSLIECIRYPEDDKLLAKYMKLSLQCDYQIFETYLLDENDFNEVIEYISPEYFLRWMRKMLSVNADFFRNEFLRERTYKILRELTLIEEYKPEIQKMKRKIQKINKGLE